MKRLSSWLLMMFSFIFWGFRVAVLLSAQLGNVFIVEPLNANLEVWLLFLTFVLLLFMIKRNLIASVIYLGEYAIYFGVDLFEKISTFSSQETVGMEMYITMFVSAIAMVLAILQLVDIIIDKSNKGNEKDKKTDWFYTNKKYDRELDERADKNNYRTL